MLIAIFSVALSGLGLVRGIFCHPLTQVVIMVLPLRGLVF